MLWFSAVVTRDGDDKFATRLPIYTSFILQALTSLGNRELEPLQLEKNLPFSALIGRFSSLVALIWKFFLLFLSSFYMFEIQLTTSLFLDGSWKNSSNGDHRSA